MTKEKETKKEKKKFKVDLSKFRIYSKGMQLIAKGIKALVEAYTGKKDVKSRISVLANPENPKSMSILTSNQCEFVATAFFASSNETWGEMFKPLEQYASEVMAVSPSKKGEGREQSIRFIGALSESKVLGKLGLTMQKGEVKEKQK